LPWKNTKLRTVRHKKKEPCLGVYSNINYCIQKELNTQTEMGLLKSKFLKRLKKNWFPNAESTQDIFSRSNITPLSILSNNSRFDYSKKIGIEFHFGGFGRIIILIKLLQILPEKIFEDIENYKPMKTRLRKRH